MELFTHLQPITIVQVSLEIWGILIAAFSECTFARTFGKQTSARVDRLLFIAVLFAIAEISLDIMAKLCRGYPGDFGSMAVRVTNFLCFFANYCLLWTFIEYLKAHFSEAVVHRNWVFFLIARTLVICVVLLLVVNIFTGWFYDFDSQNYYYRCTYYLPLQVLPVLALAFVTLVLVRERGQIERRHFLALLSFIVLPALAMLLSMVFYGFSFLELSFIISLLVIQEDRRISIIDQNIRFEEISRFNNDMVHTLAYVIDAKDHYMKGHSARVARYSREIARRMGLTPDQLREIECTSLLHDIGKVHVPDAILRKPEALDDEEYEILKEHTVVGGGILERVSSRYRLADGARYHHERYDGTGYPDGLAGEQIPLAARIIAVADAYDAMTSDRSYRQAKSQEETRQEILNGLGTQFDPQIGLIMLEMMDKDTSFLMRENPRAS